MTAVNDALEGEPELVNKSAESDGWLIKLKLKDASQLQGLMDDAAYKEHLEKGDGG